MGWDIAIHHRLVAREPTAPAELAEIALPVLIQRLKKKHPRVSDPDILDDAAATAIIDYVKQPSHFDPNRLQLLGFLTMVADRDVRNALAKMKRKKMKEINLDHVELASFVGNEKPEDQLLGQLHSSRIRGAITKLLDDKELEVFDLMADGIRSTEVFASTLGIVHLPHIEQKREVKRCKDRIKKKLQRHSEGINLK